MAFYPHEHHVLIGQGRREEEDHPPVFNEVKRPKACENGSGQNVPSWSRVDRLRFWSASYPNWTRTCIHPSVHPNLS